MLFQSLQSRVFLKRNFDCPTSAACTCLSASIAAHSSAGYPRQPVGSIFENQFETVSTAIHLIADVFCGLAVAVFLRRFVGLNLFKIQDKVTERAILTMVTQVVLIFHN
jgi:hypothetical protein